MNKLEIIKKQRKQAKDTAEDQWMVSTTKEHHPRDGDSRPARPDRPKYSFLEDPRRNPSSMQSSKGPASSTRRIMRETAKTAGGSERQGRGQSRTGRTRRSIKTGSTWRRRTSRRGRSIGKKRRQGRRQR